MKKRWKISILRDEKLFIRNVIYLVIVDFYFNIIGNFYFNLSSFIFKQNRSSN